MYYFERKMDEREEKRKVGLKTLVLDLMYYFRGKQDTKNQNK